MNLVPCRRQQKWRWLNIRVLRVAVWSGAGTTRLSWAVPAWTIRTLSPPKALGHRLLVLVTLSPSASMTVAECLLDFELCVTVSQG